MENFEKESNLMEFKECKNTLPKDFWPTYSAFANTKGGVILLGFIEEKTESVTNFVPTGVNNPERVITEMLTSLNNLQKVSYNVIEDNDISTNKIDGLEVILVKVKEAPINKKPIYINGSIQNAYIRLGESDMKMKDEQLKIMFRNSENDLDSDLLHKYTIDDLDLLSIQEYRELLIERDKKEDYSQMSVADFLISIGAMGKDRSGDGDYKIKTGGLLFFGKYNSIIDKFPHYQVDFFNKTGSNEERWIDRVSSGDNDYSNLNLFRFFRVVAEKLMNTLTDTFSLDDNMQRTSYQDLSVSLREALANMIIHADYFINSTVKVEVYKMNYIFSNPGDMKISVAEFVRGGDSKPRNPTITTLFRRIGYCERAGTGGQRIYQTAVKNKFRLPEIETGLGKTTISIWKSDIIKSHPDLSENDILIYDYINKNFYAKVNQIISDTGLSNYFVRESIKILEEKLLIKQTGKGRATKYIVNLDDMSTLATLENFVREMQTNITKKYKSTKN